MDAALRIKQAVRLLHNKVSLDINYVPEKILHRDNELQQIATNLSYALYGDAPPPLIIYGSSGTGKSTLIRYMLRGLQTNLDAINSKAKIVLLDCHNIKSPRRFGYCLAKEFGLAKPVENGVSNYYYLSLVRDTVPKDTPLIILLEDVDLLLRETRGELLMRLLSWGENDRACPMGFIATTTNLHAFDTDDPSLRSRLTVADRLFLHPYSVEQLRDILTQRAKIGLIVGSWNEAAINLIAALSAQDHGDARRAIDLLRVAVDVCQQKGDVRLEENHVYEAQRRTEDAYVMVGVRALQTQKRLALLAIVRLGKTIGGTVDTTKAYDEYHTLTRRITDNANTPVGRRRFSDYIAELERGGFIRTVDQHRGRLGRKMYAHLECDPKMVLNALREDPDLRTIINPKTVQEITPFKEAATDA